MGLTQDELDRRRNFVTATDVPAILGASPWANQADVFLEKTAGISSFGGNAATEAGLLLEPALKEWARQQLGPLLDGDWCVAENGINAATLDVMTPDREPVECKTTGIVGPGSPHQWGEAGTDEIPDYYLLQVQAQLLVTGARRAFVPALIGGRGFVMFQVQRNDEICEYIGKVSVEFWRCVKANELPDAGIIPSMDTLKRLRRTPDKTVAIPDALAQEFLAARAIASEANKREETAKRELLAAMGDADGATFSGGSFTYLEQTRKSYIVKESTFRVLHPKIPKKKSIKAGVENEQPKLETVT